VAGKRSCHSICGLESLEGNLRSLFVSSAGGMVDEDEKQLYYRGVSACLKVSWHCCKIADKLENLILVTLSSKRWPSPLVSISLCRSRKSLQKSSHCRRDGGFKGDYSSNKAFRRPRMLKDHLLTCRCLL
jgi:hypothetical protein